MSALPIFITLVPLEKVSIYTPLGIRFWDTARNAPVEDGLEAVARPPGRPDLARGAFRTQSGIYMFNNLPGLHSLEASDPNLPAGAHPAPGAFPPARFIVEVHDRSGRFQDAAFGVDLPYRGIFPTVLPPGAPGQAPPGFFLFSRSSRAAPDGLAVVRAQLVERQGPGQFRPAQYAVMEVQVGGAAPHIGIAGEDGSLVVLFPYPTFAAAAAHGSPVSGTPESRLQAWDITVRVRYRPAGQTLPDAFAQSPDLGSLLAQPFARIWPDGAGPGQAQLPARLVFSQPLQLDTAAQPALWVEVI